MAALFLFIQKRVSILKTNFLITIEGIVTILPK